MRARTRESRPGGREKMHAVSCFEITLERQNKFLSRYIHTQHNNEPLRRFTIHRRRPARLKDRRSY